MKIIGFEPGELTLGTTPQQALADVGIASAAPKSSPTRYNDPYWDDLASKAEAEVGLPKGLLVGIKNHGEKSDANRVSSAGARTPFQIIPKTRDLFLQKYGVDAYADDASAAKVAALHLKESLERGGSVEDAIGEYHGGPDRRQWGPVNEAYRRRVSTGIGDVGAAPAAPASDTPLPRAPRGAGWQVIGFAPDAEQAVEKPGPKKPAGTGEGMKEQLGYLWTDAKIGWNNLVKGFVHGRRLSEYEAMTTPEALALAEGERAKIKALDEENAGLLQQARPGMRDIAGLEGRKDLSEWQKLAELGGILVKSPGTVADIIVQSGPSSLAMIGTALLMRAGGMPPAIVASSGGTTSALIEYGNSYAGFREQGVPHEEAHKKAVSRSGIVGLFDAASIKSAGKALDDVLTKSGVGAKIATAAKEAGRQAAFGMAGEAGGSLAAGEPVSAVNVALEGIAEVGMAPGEAIAGRSRRPEAPPPAGAPPRREPPPETAEDVLGGETIPPSGGTTPPAGETTPPPPGGPGAQAETPLPPLEGVPPAPVAPRERPAPLPRIDRGMVDEVRPLDATQRLQEDVARQLATADLPPLDESPEAVARLPVQPAPAAAPAPPAPAGPPAPPAPAATASPEAGGAPAAAPPDRRLRVFLGKNGPREVEFPEDGDKVVFRLAALERAMVSGRKPYSKENIAAAKSLRQFAAKYLGTSDRDTSVIAMKYRQGVIDGAGTVPDEGGTFKAPSSKQPKAQRAAPIPAKPAQTPPKPAEPATPASTPATEASSTSEASGAPAAAAPAEAQADLEAQGVPPAAAKGIAEVMPPEEEAAAPAPAKAGQKPLPTEQRGALLKIYDDAPEGSSLLYQSGVYRKGPSGRWFKQVGSDGKPVDDRGLVSSYFIDHGLRGRPRAPDEPVPKYEAKPAAPSNIPADTEVEARETTKEERSRGMLKWKAVARTNTGGRAAVDASADTEAGAREAAVRRLGETIERREKMRKDAKRSTAKEKPAPAPTGEAFGSENKVFTKDKADRARALLKKKLGDVNAGLDPEVVQAGIELAGYYIEGGARTFAAYSKKMVEDLGDAVRPYLKSWYAAVFYHPGFSNAGMEEPSTIKEEAPADDKPKVVIREAALTPTRGGIVVKPLDPKVDAAAHAAATSPKNDLPEPTQAQKEAGNYAKGHVRVAGLDVSIENPAGSTRSGTGTDGKPWSVTMRSHYGYIRRTMGADGDQVDIFIKPGTPLDYAGPVFVVDQTKKNGHFDEHKLMLGWANVDEARAAFLANYDDAAAAERRIRGVTEWTLDRLKAWLAEGDTTKATTGTATDREALISWAAKAVISDDAFAQAPNISAVRRLAAERFGTKFDAGTEAAKLLDEAIEAAVVREARRRAHLPNAFQAIQALYAQMPTLGVRTSESIAMQAYSTPVPLAYVAGKLAGIEAAKSIYEPSAGNGALLILTREGQRVYANELDAGRAQELFAQGHEVSIDDGVTHRPREGVDVVIANPPFGIVKKGGETVRYKVKSKAAPGGSFETSEIDHAIAFKALESMAPDGRAVLIVAAPDKTITDPEARMEAYNSAAKRKFYFALYNDYNVIEHFTVDGDLYEKQGAGWPVDVIVIQGRGKAARELPAANLPKIYGSWTELASILDRVGTRPDGLVPESLRAGDGRGGAPAEKPPAGPVLPGARPAGQETRPDDAGRAPTGHRHADPGGSPQRVPGGPGRRAEGVGDGQRAPQGAPAGDAGARPATEGTAGGAGRARAAQPGQPGGVAERRDDAAPERQVTQVPYRPRSSAESVNTLVPVNLQTAVDQALTSLETRLGSSVDAFVAAKLGYKPDELGRYFSAEQVDALALAIDNMDRGAGFIIGDQTGIGKGRVVAGVIRYAVQKGKVPIFVTEKPNLYADMYRDLSDIGMADFRPLMTNAGEKVPLDDDGRKTLKTADGKGHAALLRELMDKGRLEGYDGIFTTYNQMQTVQGKSTVRQEFLRAFARDGFVIFDESHNAGGTEANDRSKEGKQGLKEGRAGFARAIAGAADGVFYSSATYAKRPSVMDLYFKTDMRLAVDNITKLGAAIAAGGVPLQQAVAAMLTRAGQYIRRERSFDGINYNTVEATVDRSAAETFSTMLREINTFDRLYKAGAVKAMKDQVRGDAKKVTEDGSIGQAGVHSTNFTSIMHNLIEQFLLALKVKPATELAIERLKRGEKVVITVANTMGSFMKEFADDNNINNGDVVDLSFRDLLVRYLDSSRRVHIKDAFGRGTVYMLGERDFGPLGWSKFKELKEMIQRSDFGDVPISPIDYIRSSLKRAGYESDEITGRGSTLEYREKGHPIYKVRPGKETSIAGRRQSLSRFNNGKTSVLVLNQAGATGLSLHASSKFADKRKRRMIVVQSEKNIDTHMQMLGRINRTGQVVLPEYDQLVADIPAEKRPAAVLSKKMASLNANTTASRGGAMTAKDVPDFMNDYGDEVVARLMSDDPDMHRAMGSPLERDEKTGEFSAEEAIRKVTGRIPLLKLADQEALYDLIESEYQQRVALADAMGENMLEAKTLPLEAETRARVRLFDGKGASPFQEPSDIELVVAKRIGKPYTPKQLATMIRKELGLAEGASEEDVRRAAARRAEDALKGIEAAYDGYLAEQTLDEEDQRKVDTIKARLADMRRRVDSLLRELPIGKAMILSSELFQLPAIITKVEKKGTTKNPVGLGAWKVTFAIPDAARHVTLSFRDLGEFGSDVHGETDYRVGDYASFRTHGTDPDRAEDAFEHAQSQSREVRYIAVGNMLAAFSKVGRGSIVNYTTNTGDVRQGILLPKNFEPKEGITKAQEGFDNADQVLKYFGLADRGRVTGMSGELTLLERGAEYWLSVPKSKDRGGPVYLDEQLRDDVGNFVSAGNSMRLRFSGRQLEAVVKRLYEKGVTLVAEADQEAAQKAKGKSVDETQAGLEKMGVLEERIRAEMRPGGDGKLAVDDGATIPGDEGQETQQEALEGLRTLVEGASGKSVSPGAYRAAALPEDVGRLGDAFATRVIGFRVSPDAPADTPPIAGAQVLGRLYINVAAHRPHMAVLGHEFLHELRRQDPDLYAEFVRLVRPYINASQYGVFVKAMKDQGYGWDRPGFTAEENAERAEEEIREEFMADIVGDGFMHESFWETLGRHNPTLLGKVFAIVKRLVERARAAFTPRTMQFLTDYDRVMRIAGMIVAKYEGRKAAVVDLGPKLERERTLTVEMVDKAIAKVGEERFTQAVERHTARTAERIGRALTPEEEAFAVEATARSIVGAEVAKFAFEKDRKGFATRARALVDRIDRMLEPIGGLPDRESYLKMRYAAQGVIANVDRIGRELYDTFSKASVDDQGAAYTYLTTRDQSPSIIESDTVREHAVKTKNMIDTVGRALVQRGLLSEEAFEAHRGAYLPRLYLKHLLSAHDWKAIGTGKKPSEMGYLKHRKDIPADVREVLLGEVKDPGFLSAVGFTRSMRDMALLDWMAKVAQNDEWALPASMVVWNGRRVTPFWLASEADSLRKRLEFYDSDEAKAKARKIADEMDRVANAAIGDLRFDEKQWKQMPNTGRYGRLRGLVVRKEIYDDVVGVGAFMPEDASWAEKIFGYGGAGTKVTQVWKATKVSLNPPSQVRNFVSNAVLLHLSGVPFVMVPVRIAQAARAMRTDGEAWRVAKKYGVTANTFAAQELIRIEREMLDMKARDAGPFAFIHIANIAAKVIGAAGDVYQAMEALFKTAKIIDAMKRGAPAEEAVLQANKWLFDYSLVAPSIRYLRNAPVGAPFLTFTAKVAPRMLEVMAFHPWRLIPYVAMAYSIPMLVASMLGVDPDDLDKLKKLLPESWQDKGHVYVLPIKDEAGRWQVVDLSYFLPWAMFTEAASEARRGDIIGMTKTLGLLGGPLPDLISAWKTGRDPFTGKDIVPKGAPPSLQAGALATYVMDMFLPPFMSSRGIVGIDLADPDGALSGKLVKALEGETNRYGDPRSTVAQAGASIVGVNVRSVDPLTDRANKIRVARREVEDTRQEMRTKLLDRSLSPEARERIRDRYVAEMKRRQEKLMELERETRVPAALQ